MFSLAQWSLALAVTAAVAGAVPTQLFFGETERRKVIVVGVAATIAAHVAVHLGIPYLVALTIDGHTVFPAWAILLGFPIAGTWKLIEARLPGPKSDDERMAEIRRKAREKARRHERNRGR